MSGAAYGTAVLHVSPEAAAGGPLGWVRTGDMVELDVAGRRLDLLVDEEAHVRGYRKLYNSHVEQAHKGCDFDFLRGANPGNLPEGLFDGWVGGW